MSDSIEETIVIDRERQKSSQNEIVNLYDSYRAPLIRFFSRKLPKGDDPEDMVQKVFIKLVRAERQPDFVNSKSLIFVIAKNVLIDHLRWRKSRKIDNHGLLLDNVIASGMPLPDRELQGKQQLDSFFSHLDNLPMRCKQVFLLHRVNNMSQQDIAEYLGISRSTVQKHMMNAMAKLHAAIGNIEDL